MPVVLQTRISARDKNSSRQSDLKRTTAIILETRPAVQVANRPQCPFLCETQRNNMPHARRSRFRRILQRLGTFTTSPYSLCSYLMRLPSTESGIRFLNVLGNAGSFANPFLDGGLTCAKVDGSEIRMTSRLSLRRKYAPSAILQPARTAGCRAVPKGQPTALFPCLL